MYYFEIGMMDTNGLSTESRDKKSWCNCAFLDKKTLLLVNKRRFQLTHNMNSYLREMK